MSHWDIQLAYNENDLIIENMLTSGRIYPKSREYHVVSHKVFNEDRCDGYYKNEHEIYNSSTTRKDYESSWGYESLRTYSYYDIALFEDLEPLKGEITLFPNPVLGDLHIQLTDIITYPEIGLINAMDRRY